MTISTEIARALESLRKERRSIDDKIAALELAIETLGGAPPVIAKKVARRPRTARRRVDRDGVAKSIAWLAEHGKPASNRQIARAVGGTPDAARMRMGVAAKAGKVVRVSDRPALWKVQP